TSRASRWRSSGRRRRIFESLVSPTLALEPCARHPHVPSPGGRAIVAGGGVFATSGSEAVAPEPQRECHTLIHVATCLLTGLEIDYPYGSSPWILEHPPTFARGPCAHVRREFRS